MFQILSQRFLFPLLVIFCAIACDSKTLPDDAEADSSVSAPMPDETETTITSVTITDGTLIELDLGELMSLDLAVALDNGEIFTDVTADFAADTFPATEVLWFSNDTSVVSVSTAGVLTAVSAGSTFIKATVYNRSDTVEVIVLDPADANQSVDPDLAPRALADLAFATKPLTQTRTESSTLLFAVRFADDDSIDSVTWDELDSIAICEPELELSNPYVADLKAGGLFVPKAYGLVSTSIFCGDLADTWTVRVQTTASGEMAELPDEAPIDEGEFEEPVEEPEAEEPAENEEPVEESEPDLVSQEPDTIDDAFLGSDDEFVFIPDAAASYGHDEFPTNVYGPPVSSRTDVVSFGTGGELVIELHGYVIVNDSGVDFTIFENPFSGWTERATVAVSSDGETYYEFPCDAFDPELVYEGCAGVAEVNYSAVDEDMLDPETSGGDTFDLADLDAPEPIRYIKITDAETCTNPVLCTTSAGFDLDALAIINGIND